MHASKRNRSRRWALAALLTAWMLPGMAAAEDYSLTNLQMFYTNNAKSDVGTGTGTSDEKLAVFRFEHYGTWKYGNNYINLDYFRGRDLGGEGAGSFGGDTKDSTFFVYVPRISLKQTFGWGGGDGFVKDIYLAGRLELASYGDFHANNVGVSFDLAVPGTAFFEQDFYVRRTNFDDGNQWLSRTLWLAPFKLGSLGAHYDGLVLIKSADTAGTDLFTQQDLLIDVVPRGMVQAGVRLEYHRTDDDARFSPYLLLKIVF